MGKRAEKKRSPGDFGLEPPAAPRPDKTLCDEAGVTARATAQGLLTRAYHGYPIRQDDPFFREVIAAWDKRNG